MIKARNYQGNVDISVERDGECYAILNVYNYDRYVDDDAAVYYSSYQEAYDAAFDFVLSDDICNHLNDQLLKCNQPFLTKDEIEEIEIIVEDIIMPTVESTLRMMFEEHSQG